MSPQTFQTILYTFFAGFFLWAGWALFQKIRKGSRAQNADAEFREQYADDLKFLEETLQVPLDEQMDYIKALQSIEETGGVKFRDLYQNPEWAASYWQGVGQSYFDDANFQRARECFENSLGFYAEHGLEAIEHTARMWCNYGVALTELGEPDRAIEQFEKSLAFNRKIDEDGSEQIVVLLHNLGWAHEGKGDTGKALDFYQQSLTLAETLNFDDGIQQLTPKIQKLKTNPG